MRRSRSLLLAGVLAVTGAGAAAQTPTASGRTVPPVTTLSTRRAAEFATGLRVVVSVARRRLWVLVRHDTLLSAPVAVGTGSTLRYGSQRWVFRTPRGVRLVLAKSADPVWVPPDWLYADAAASHGLRLARLDAGRPVRLRDGRLLTISDGVVGLVGADAVFDALPLDEHIVFDGTLFIPPTSTRNRRIRGELGKYRLDLGDGYLLHGTPHLSSIGSAATHGCIRLGDADIAWLYAHVPIGTRVYIY